MKKPPIHMAPIITIVQKAMEFINHLLGVVLNNKLATIVEYIYVHLNDIYLDFIYSSSCGNTKKDYV